MEFFFINIIIKFLINKNIVDCGEPVEDEEIHPEIIDFVNQVIATLSQTRDHKRYYIE